MPSIQWEDTLAIGIYAIDRQHMDLLALVNEFLKAVAQKRGKDVVEKIVARLREYTVLHFHDEEAYMNQVRYPARGEHQMRHQELARAVKLFQRDLYKHRDVPVEQLRQFLKDWLINHILEQDMKIGKWVRAEEERRKIKAGEKEVPVQGEVPEDEGANEG